MNNGDSPVLSNIAEGSVLEFSLGGQPVCVQEYQGSGFLVLEPRRPAAAFIAAIYTFDGGWHAKISLAHSRGCWTAAPQSVSGIANPMVMGPNEGQFLLTDEGHGLVSIQNTFALTGPYIQAEARPLPHLAHGFDSALLNVFAISVSARSRRRSPRRSRQPGNKQTGPIALGRSLATLRRASRP
jgi:hypothetical protein